MPLYFVFLRHVIPPTPCMHLFCPPTYHMSHAPHSSRFDHPNKMWREIKIIKLFVMQFPSGPCHIFPFMFKYLLRHPFRNIFSLGRFFSARDEALHPRKKTQNRSSMFLSIVDQKTKDRSSGPKGSRFSARVMFLNFSWMRF